MSTSVKLSEEDKRKLEKLQALVTIRTSRKITQQEILSELIRSANEQGDMFVDTIIKKTVPMSDEAYKKLLALTSDWKVKTSSDEIDTILYGESKKRKAEPSNRRNN